MSEWHAEELALDAYLTRIGVQAPLAPTVATLVRLHRAHVTSIPFENLDVLLGRGVSLELGQVQDKLVTSRRGGYCGEHNLLFAAVLERIGFPVTRALARLRMGTNVVNPLTHVLTLAEAEGCRWLTDVGFGGECLIEPIALREDEPVTQDGWRFRVMRSADGSWVLQSLRTESWFDLYSFTGDSQHLVDLEVANYYMATSPVSPFVHRLIVQLPGVTKHVLAGTQMTSTRADGFRSCRTLATTEVGMVLRSAFGINLTADDEAGIVAWLSRGTGTRAQPAAAAVR